MEKLMCQGWCALIPWGEGVRLVPSQTLSPMCLFIWLVLICILYNKTIIISIMLSLFLCVIVVKYLTWEYLLWELHAPHICNQLVKSAFGFETPECSAGWNEDSLVGNLALNLWNLTLTHHLLSKLYIQKYDFISCVSIFSSIKWILSDNVGSLYDNVCIVLRPVSGPLTMCEYICASACIYVPCGVIRKWS